MSRVAEVLAVAAEMRERQVARQFKSPTLIAWADRIEAAVKEREAAVAELIEAAVRLQARGFFDATSCADKATNVDMASMRAALARIAGAAPATPGPVATVYDAMGDRA